MSDVIDTNVVQLKFDSAKFLDNVAMTQAAVESLKGSLTFDSNSFEELNRVASRIDLSNVADNIQTISDRFSTFGIVGMTVIQRITNGLIDLGGKIRTDLQFFLIAEHLVKMIDAILFPDRLGRFKTLQLLLDMFGDPDVVFHMPVRDKGTVVSFFAHR